MLGTQRCCIKLRSMGSQLACCKGHKICFVKINLLHFDQDYFNGTLRAGISMVFTCVDPFWNFGSFRRLSVQWTPKYISIATENCLSSTRRTSRTWKVTISLANYYWLSLPLTEKSTIMCVLEITLSRVVS